MLILIGNANPKFCTIQVANGLADQESSELAKQIYKIEMPAT